MDSIKGIYLVVVQVRFLLREVTDGNTSFNDLLSSSYRLNSKYDCGGIKGEVKRLIGKYRIR